MRIGDSIIGSDATSSTRYPGGMENVFIASSGDERDRLLHLLLSGRPDVPRDLGGALSGDDGRETDGAREDERESNACSIHGCELAKTINAVLNMPVTDARRRGRPAVVRPIRILRNTTAILDA